MLTRDQIDPELKDTRQKKADKNEGKTSAEEARAALEGTGSTLKKQ